MRRTAGVSKLPVHAGWERTARPDDPNRYLMLSADCHCNEPSTLWWTRLDEKFKRRYVTDWMVAASESQV